MERLLVRELDIDGRVGADHLKLVHGIPARRLEFGFVFEIPLEVIALGIGSFCEINCSLAAAAAAEHI